MISKNEANEAIRKELQEENRQLKMEIDIMKKESSGKETFLSKVAIEKQRQLLNEK